MSKSQINIYRDFKWTEQKQNEAMKMSCKMYA